MENELSIRQENEAEQKKREQYEKLIVRRDALKKEAAGWRVAYMKEFGALIVRVYRKELDCIKIKKSIAFCQRQVNAGKKINLEEMNRFLEEVMANYHAQLRDLIEDFSNCEQAKTVAEHNVMKAKAIYRKIAKMIHPDLHPQLAGDEKIAELWNRAAEAYLQSDADELDFVQVLVEQHLRIMKIETHFSAIPQIDRKIAGLRLEIQKIMDSDPYQYRFLLEDPEAVKETRAQYEEQLAMYEEYEQKLQEIHRTYLQQGVIVPCAEN